MHQESKENHSGMTQDTHWMFVLRTEVNGGLSVDPQSFSQVKNGQVRLFESKIPMWYSEIA